VDKEHLSCALKSKTFGNMSQKLWPNMLLFFRKWVVRANWRKSLFTGLVCEQLWILYFKINFKILYVTQLSIFSKKTKIIAYSVATQMSPFQHLSPFWSVAQVIGLTTPQIQGHLSHPSLTLHMPRTSNVSPQFQLFVLSPSYRDY